jgi:hypothetical protein
MASEGGSLAQQVCSGRRDCAKLAVLEPIGQLPPGHAQQPSGLRQIATASTSTSASISSSALPLSRVYEYYFAGPPPMTQGLQEMLMVDFRVPFGQVHFDRFF